MLKASDSDIIESLPLVELANYKERVRGFLKFRALKVTAFRKYNAEYLQIIPHPDSGVSEHDFFKLLSIKEMMTRLPADVFYKGGWILFNEDFISEFLTREEFKEKYRFIESIDIEYLIRSTCFKITKVSISKNDPTVKIIRCDDTSWMMSEALFDLLTPRAGDYLMYTINKRFKIIRGSQMAEVTPSSRETNYAGDVAEVAEVQHIGDFKEDGNSNPSLASIGNHANQGIPVIEEAAQEPQPVSDVEPVRPDIVVPPEMAPAVEQCLSGKVYMTEEDRKQAMEGLNRRSYEENA